MKQVHRGILHIGSMERSLGVHKWEKMSVCVFVVPYVCALDDKSLKWLCWLASEYNVSVLYVEGADVYSSVHALIFSLIFLLRL